MEIGTNPVMQNTLRDLVLRHVTGQGRHETAIPGLALSRFDEDTPVTRCFYTPMLALVVQGWKHSLIGDHEANYGKNHCVVVGVDLPGVYHVTAASPEEPFLSLSIRLDRQIISGLLGEMPSPPDKSAVSDAAAGAVMVAGASPELLEAFTRLVGLLDSPGRIPVLAPMILREIHYYILCGSQGACLRLFNTSGTQGYRIASAIAYLRANYSSSLLVEDLARQANMAPSTFHRHFREVTGMSPLQFQKRLRLYEAERLMLQEGRDAGTAALMVGYESGSQFNREYKRQFGEPPHRDVNRKRA